MLALFVPPARLFLSCGLLFALASPLAAAGPGSWLDSTPVGVPATRECFSDNVRVTGYLMPRREAYVAMNQEGFRIAEVLAQEGDQVSADQELVRLTRLGPADPRAAAAGQAGAPATIALRAPAAGVIARSTARVGALTNPRGEPLFRITVDPALDAVIEVPSLYVTKIRAGAPARLFFEDGLELGGSVRVPASDVDPATQFGRARVAVTPNPALRAGMFASALIDTARSCGIAVPRSAIMRQNDTASVQVLRDGRVELRRVRVGLSSEDNVEIREGLSEGESVVANAGLAF
jgi:multidrug efflux pump subunit AcrA (membrane-fusion protein)